MPTPPIGDIACAASPMQRRPGRYHWDRRSTHTVKSLTSSQSRSSCVRSLTYGTSRATALRNARSPRWYRTRSEEHTSELQSRQYLVCRLLLEKKKKKKTTKIMK